MSLAVHFTMEAVADITALYDYIAPRGGKQVAVRYVERIYEYCLSMGTFPERGMRRDDIWQGLRLVGFERKATIAIEVTLDEVRIVRVFSRGQDVVAELHG